LGGNFILFLIARLDKEELNYSGFKINKVASLILEIQGFSKV
jgi:hypothetical protein